MIINALGEYKVGHGHSAIFGENLYRRLVDKDVDSGGVTRHHERSLYRWNGESSIETGLSGSRGAVSRNSTCIGIDIE